MFALGSEIPGRKVGTLDDALVRTLGHPDLGTYSGGYCGQQKFGSGVIPVLYWDNVT